MFADSISRPPVAGQSSWANQPVSFRGPPVRTTFPIPHSTGGQHQLVGSGDLDLGPLSRVADTLRTERSLQSLGSCSAQENITQNRTQRQL